MKKDESWQELCFRAANEPDPATLRKLVVRINELIDREQRRFPALSAHQTGSAPRVRPE
jgi:hypothetical protein